MTLDDLLMLAGRLDDEPGFDTARERFRRFLTERVADTVTLRALIEQSQHVASEQHRRALQDLVAALGRTLGFSTRFATYVARSGERQIDGLWHSARGADLNLIVCSDPAKLPRTLVDAPHAANGRSLVLYVLTPACEARAQVDGILKAAHPDSGHRVITLRSLLTLAQMFGAARLSHDDVVRLFESGSDLEFVIGLLERTAKGEKGPDAPRPVEGAVPRRAEPVCWVATIAADQGVAPEQVVLHGPGERHELEVTETAATELAPQPGDGICYHIPGVGIVGFSDVREVGERRSTGEDQFKRTLQVEHVVLHLDVPRPLGYEIQLRLRVEGRRKPKGHWLARISRHEYTRVTTGLPPERHHDAASATAASSARTDAQPVSAGDSPLRA